MGPEGCPEMSVINYRFTVGNIPEEQRSHLHRNGSLKEKKTYMLRITDGTS